LEKSYILTSGDALRPEMNHPVAIEMGYDGTGRVTVTATDGKTGESVAREFSKQAEADLTAMYAHLKKLTLRA